MHFTLVSGILLAMLALFTQAAEPAKSIGEWTVSSAQRIRSANNTTCNWSFHIQGNSSIGGGIFMAPIVCNDIWQVNTGHSDLGFTVMVLVNQPLYSDAFFGFSDKDLDARNDIAAQTSDAYPNGANKRGLATKVRGRAVPNPDAEPQTWLVEDVVRYVNQAKTTVTMSFNIQDGSATGSPCDLRLESPKGVDASTWAWYDQKCKGSGYTVSWGYNSTSDAGIMTLVSPARDRHAYFGWDHLNKVAALETKGPSPVIPCQC
ncbi:uncharacterized protein PG986_004381 [Apiospora aurea]|uniref:Uncharacterized protein n=1 Tax=Apiospora aurea TaxID=335848 RepID=A0ABR1QMF6_9PEZI